MSEGLPRRPRPSAERVGALVPRVLSELGLGAASAALRVLEVWDEVLGPDLAPHCRPEGLRRGAVVARVPDSAWMQRLQLEKLRILEGLRHRLGENAPADLRLRIGVPEPTTPGRGRPDRSEPSG